MRGVVKKRVHVLEKHLLPLILVIYIFVIEPYLLNKQPPFPLSFTNGGKNLLKIEIASIFLYYEIYKKYIIYNAVVLPLPILVANSTRGRGGVWRGRGGAGRFL